MTKEDIKDWKEMGLHVVIAAAVLFPIAVLGSMVKYPGIALLFAPAAAWGAGQLANPKDKTRKFAKWAAVASGVFTLIALLTA